jgi:hypothetical protein
VPARFTSRACVRTRLQRTCEAPHTVVRNVRVRAFMRRMLLGDNCVDDWTRVSLELLQKLKWLIISYAQVHPLRPH